MNAETITIFKNRLENLKVLMIDEISMVSLNLFFSLIDKILYFKNYDIYDTTNLDNFYNYRFPFVIIMLGDLFQLEPVKEKALFLAFL